MTTPCSAVDFPFPNLVLARGVLLCRGVGALPVVSLKIRLCCDRTAVSFLLLPAVLRLLRGESEDDRGNSSCMSLEEGDSMPLELMHISRAVNISSSVEPSTVNGLVSG